MTILPSRFYLRKLSVSGVIPVTSRRQARFYDRRRSRSASVRRILSRYFFTGDSLSRAINPTSSDLPAAEPAWGGIALTAWLKIFVVTALMCWLFYVPDLRRLWQKTNPFTGEANWGHSVIIPIVGLYYLYLNRDELLRAKIKPLIGADFSRVRLIGGSVICAIGAAIYFFLPKLAPQFSAMEYVTGGAAALAALGILGLLFDWGLGTLLFGLLIFVYGIYPGQNDWEKDFGMVATLFGIVLTLCGWEVMKIAWFPIVFLICGLPWPGTVYSKIAMPLQQMAATVAVNLLQVFGVQAMRSGTKIMMGDGIITPISTLNVAEACAGMRSLMTFISLGASLAFLSNRPLWQKLIITVSAIPIAIFCNVMRVTGQGLLDQYWNHDVSQGFAHQFVGMVMLVPAFFLILLVGWLLDQIFVEEADEHRPVTMKVGGRAQSHPGAGA
jgi:exosortase